MYYSMLYFPFSSFYSSGRDMGQISGSETLITALKKNGVKRIYGAVGIPVLILRVWLKMKGLIM